MSKYAPLQAYLEKSQNRIVPMTFREIEEVVGFVLPPSSRAHRAWWSNNPSNNVMTRAWLDAGFETTNVDIAAEKLVFHRMTAAMTNDNSAREVTNERGTEKRAGKRHPLFGALAGTVTIAEGVDLTEPADPDWGKLYD